MKGNKKIKIANVFFEANEKQYKEIKGEYNHSYYLRTQEEEAEIDVVSLDAMKESEYGGRETIADSKVNVAEEVERKILLEKMWDGVRQLTADEFYIINETILKEKTERKTLREIAEILNVSHTMVKKRRDAILKKLKKFLGN